MLRFWGFSPLSVRRQAPREFSKLLWLRTIDVMCLLVSFAACGEVRHFLSSAPGCPTVVAATGTMSQAVQPRSRVSLDVGLVEELVDGNTEGTTREHLQQFG